MENPNREELERRSKALDGLFDLMSAVMTGRKKKEMVLFKQVKKLGETATKFAEYSMEGEANLPEEKLDEMIEYLGMVQTGLEQYLSDNPISVSEEEK